MDCTKGQNHELCKQEGVEGYPTFNYYNYGKFVEKYNGDRGVSTTYRTRSHTGSYKPHNWFNDIIEPGWRLMLLHNLHAPFSLNGAVMDVKRVMGPNTASCHHRSGWSISSLGRLKCVLRDNLTTLLQSISDKLRYRIKELRNLLSVL